MLLMMCYTKKYTYFEGISIVFAFFLLKGARGDACGWLNVLRRDAFQLLLEPGWSLLQWTVMSARPLEKVGRQFLSHLYYSSRSVMFVLLMDVNLYYIIHTVFRMLNYTQYVTTSKIVYIELNIMQHTHIACKDISKCKCKIVNTASVTVHRRAKIFRHIHWIK